MDYGIWDLQIQEWMNRNFWTTLGCSPLEMPHKSILEDIIHAEDLKKRQKFHQTLRKP
jgi:hypothetical protein